MEKIVESLKQNYILTEFLPIKLLRESGDNFVYIVGENDKKILRISKRLPIEDIKFEYEAITHLFKGGLLVPEPIKTKMGDFYTLIEGCVAVVFNFIDGHHIEIDKDHLPTTNQAYNAGRGLGLMSNIASGFVSTSPRKRNIYTEFNRVLDMSEVFIQQFEGGAEFVKQANDLVAFAKNQSEVEGLIHNDYRAGNVFFNNNDEFAGIIDFDWSCNGPIIKDLALAVVEWSFQDGKTEPDLKLFDSFLEGYNSISNNKCLKDARLYSWIKFATLSDASTYFCDRSNDPAFIKKIGRSYMYNKYKYFSNL